MPAPPVLLTRAPAEVAAPPGFFAPLGRTFVAVALVASGLQQIFIRDFVRLVPKLPEWVPWHSFWAILTGLIFVLLGTALVVRVRARLAALLLAALLLATFLFQRVPEIISNPLAGFMWTNPCKVLALLGGALLLARNAPGSPASAPGSKQGATIVAAGLLGVFLLVCGVQHFVYAGFVDTLVPVWIPPSARFWTCFSGTALIAGGLGLLLPPLTRWAALLSGLMIFLWVILLHIPRALADRHNPGETSAVFEALALSGVCLLVAAARRPRRN